jgi:hypothetical protein
MEDGPSFVPVVAILFVVGMAIVVTLVMHFVKPKRTIDNDFFGTSKPRAVQPTLSDAEGEQPRALPPASEMQLVTLAEGTASASDAPLAELITAQTVPTPPTNGAHHHHVCKSCGQTDDPALVELEDWHQVKTVRGLMRAKRKKRTPLEHGRELYAARFLCRSCAKIASHLNEVFVRELDLERQRATVAFDAREQKWEREGLITAVRRTIDLETERYTEEQKALEREDTKRRAAKVL